MEFHEWLRQQDGRQDAVGHLARLMLADPISPFWSNRLCTYRSYLIYRDAGEIVIKTLEAAFREWKYILSASVFGQT